jgi:V8-like Glu-specific endopeptidase
MEKIYVYPGLNGDRRNPVFPAAETRLFYSVEAWVLDQNRDFDLGAIILPTPLGDYAGWFSVSRFTTQTLDSLTVTVSGYPHTPPVESSPGTTQWHDVSRIDVESNRLRHWADTSIGQSGSPVFAYFPDKPNKYHVVGVHNWGYDAENVATRINEAVFAQIAAWRKMSEQIR